MNKRKLAVALTIGMTAALLAGCGGGSEKSSETTKAALEKDASDNGLQPVKERVTMTIGKAENTSDKYEPGDSVGDNFILRWYEDHLNIDYQYQWVAAGGDAYNQKSSLIISTGELPDVMTVTEAQLRQLVKAGMIEDLTDAYHTFASDILKESYETTNGISLDSATFDGKLMAIPNINPGADGIPLLFLRGDWMDELGLKDPKTLDDIVNIVKAFKEKKGSQGLVASNQIVKVGNNICGLDAIFALYNSYPELWVTDADGRIAYGSIQPETREALKKLAELVQEGVLEKDFAVKDQEQCNEIITSGKGGAFFGAWWNYDWPLSDMWLSNPDLKWNSYAVPLTEDGIYNTHMLNPSTTYLVVRKGYEHLEAVMKTVNLQIDTEFKGIKIIDKPVEDAWANWTMFPFSILLTTYDDKEKIAQEIDSVISGEKTKEEIRPDRAILSDTYRNVLEKGMQEAKKENKYNGWSFYMGSKTIVEAEDHMNRVFASTYAQSPSMDKKWATLEKLEDETFLQIILGEKPIEAFDEFVVQWKSLGGDDITRELQEMSDSK